MRGAGVLAAAALLLAGAARAAPGDDGLWSHLLNAQTLLLAAGERVTLRLADDGGLTLVSVIHAQPGDLALPQTGPQGAPPVVRTPAGTVAFTVANSGGNALLKVENATGRAFDYQAALLDGVSLPAKAVPTSVCTVPARLAGYESWPKRHVPALLLGRFTPRDTDQVACPQPQGPPLGLPPARDATATPAN